MPKPSDSTRNYPRLRTRQQLTIRYHEINDELAWWRGLANQDSFNRKAVHAQFVVQLNIASCEAQLDVLLYALNGVV